MDFIRFIYRTHGIYGFIIGLGGLALLGFFLMPSHPITEVRTWIAFAGYMLALAWYSIGWSIFKDEKVRFARDSVIKVMEDAGYTCREITGEEG